VAEVVKCKTCGDTDPAHFYAYRQFMCRACRNRQLQSARRRYDDTHRTGREFYARNYHQRQLSGMERRLLTYVRMRLKWGFPPPSLAEIAQAVRVSIPTVRTHIERLEAAGKIIRQPRKHRGLQVVG